MNREEILALTDDELQREVAKAQGYRVERVVSLGMVDLYAPNGDVVDTARRRGSRFAPAYDDAEAWLCTPDYPWGIAAAWPLLEDIESRGGSWVMDGHANHNRGLKVTHGWIHSFAPLGPTDVARAICRAYLLAKVIP